MTRLLHVNVVVPPGRTEDVVPFYLLLGLQRVPKPARGTTRAQGAWFALAGGQQLHVSEREGAVHPDQHVCFEVEDLPGVVARLQQAGRPWRPLPSITGADRGMTADPAGNAVELWAAP